MAEASEMGLLIQAINSTKVGTLQSMLRHLVHKNEENRRYVEGVILTELPPQPYSDSEAEGSDEDAESDYGDDDDDIQYLETKPIAPPVNAAPDDPAPEAAVETAAVQEPQVPVQDDKVEEPRESVEDRVMEEPAVEQKPEVAEQLPIVEELAPSAEGTVVPEATVAEPTVTEPASVETASAESTGATSALETEEIAVDASSGTVVSVEQLAEVDVPASADAAPNEPNSVPQAPVVAPQVQESITITDDSPAPPVQLKRKRARYVHCVRCRSGFDVMNNPRGSCRYHIGELEFNWDYRYSWGGKIQGEDAYEDNRVEDYPERFNFSCCDAHADDPGCRSGQHRAPDDRPTKEKHRELYW